MASRAPHNRALNALRAEALAVAGRFAEARVLCLTPTPTLTPTPILILT